MLPYPGDSNAEEILREHAYAYPRGGKVFSTVESDEMVLR